MNRFADMLKNVAHCWKVEKVRYIETFSTLDGDNSQAPSQRQQTMSKISLRVPEEAMTSL